MGVISANSLQSTPRAPVRILVVDDDPLLRTAIAMELAEQGFEVLEAQDAASALVVLQSEKGIAVVLSDIEMPGPKNGTDLALAIQSAYPDIRILVLSAHEPDPVLISVADAVLAKPFNLTEIITRIRALVGST